ncbi:MAG: manganese efflux pump [Bacteroidales bacterium]|nr:manganese efflux pump [Bacteroidales bacterium]
MNLVEALLIALSLCVDSLVVSATTALHSRITLRRGWLMAAVFGLCQGAFPLAGALIGDVARAFIEAVDHWVAFGLLLAVGGKMLLDGLRSKDDSAAAPRTSITLPTMFLLGVATSIDAFAVGIGLGLEHTLADVLWTVALIGAMTFGVSLLGVHLGRRSIPVPERAATIVAGLVLTALGTKILLQHLLTQPF